MNIKIKTPYNAEDFPRYGSINNLPSETIPDQTMSLKTLLEKYARGLPLQGQREEIYHGEEFLPDLKTLDLSEVEDWKAENAELILQLQAQAQMEKELADKKRKPQPKNMDDVITDLTPDESDSEEPEPESTKPTSKHGKTKK